MSITSKGITQTGSQTDNTKTSRHPRAPTVSRHTFPAKHYHAKGFHIIDSS